MDFASTYVGVLLALVATGFGFPVTEEIILILGGVAAYQGGLDWRALVGVGLAGVMLGDLWVYFVGRHWGRKLLRVRFFRWLLPPARVETAERLYATHSIWALFIARFVLTLKAPAFFSAGLLRIRFHRFIIADGVAACIHVPLYVLIGFLFSPRAERVLAYLKRADRWIAVTLIIAFVLGGLYVGYLFGTRRAPANGAGQMAEPAILPEKRAGGIEDQVDD